MEVWTWHLLNRRVYSLADAAEILRISPSTLEWWLEGGRRGKREYPPVIRSKPTGDRSLTWAEFVEAGLLRQYRRDLGVRLHEIRAFVASLRDELGVEHPLAHAGPWVGEGPRLLMRVQEECGLSADLWLIAHVTGQLVLLPAADSFVRRVEWEGDLPAAWRPHDDGSSPVRCRPGRRFGRPAIEVRPGIRRERRLSRSAGRYRRHHSRYRPHLVEGRACS